MRFNLRECVERGLHGSYVRVVDDLGVKVYQKDTPNARAEYLLTHLASSTGLTSEPLAFGVVSASWDHREHLRPAIWLRHLDGIPIDKYCRRLGWNIDPRFDSAEAEEIGLESDVYKNVLAPQMEIILEKLTDLGFACVDHCEHAGNFMYCKDGSVKAFDFSLEAMAKNKKLLARAIENYAHTLELTLPPACYMSRIHQCEILTL